MTDVAGGFELPRCVDDRITGVSTTELVQVFTASGSAASVGFSLLRSGGDHAQV
jgi:hypothetical protein